jgi:hypothetical protein
VVVPAIDEPDPDVVRVVRSDLLRPSRFYDAPVWTGTSADNMYWTCSVWQARVRVCRGRGRVMEGRGVGRRGGNEAGQARDGWPPAGVARAGGRPRPAPVR